MELYNIEIFSPTIAYKSSYQVKDMEYHEDYLVMDNGRVMVPKIKAAEGDYIRITSTKRLSRIGIVVRCEDKGNETEIQFKPMLTLFDMDVHFDKEQLKEESFEEWLADILNSTFGINEDPLQNIPGFRAVARTKTMDAIIGMEENIGNLYDIMTEALIKYGIVVKSEIRLKEREVLVYIQRNEEASLVIEADMPNIIKKSFTIKQADRTVNKLSVYNALNEDEHAEFYMLQDGSITKDSRAAGRIQPVVSNTIYINYEENTEQSFEDAAYEKAFSQLLAPAYNNLIELTVNRGDTLIHPEKMEIGQKVKIIRDGQIYDTVLTGKIESKTIKLIFGAVRVELTKILKRRMQK